MDLCHKLCKKNVGKTDKVARAVIALVLIGLIATGTVQGVLSVILGVFAAVLAITAYTGICPGYNVMGLKSCMKEGEQPSCCGGSCKSMAEKTDKTEETASVAANDQDKTE